MFSSKCIQVPGFRETALINISILHSILIWRDNHYFFKYIRDRSIFFFYYDEKAKKNGKKEKIKQNIGR